MDSQNFIPKSSHTYIQTKEYKERTDINSPTGPNETVCVATLLLNIYLRETKRTAKWKASPHPPTPPAEAGRRRKLYHMV